MAQLGDIVGGRYKILTQIGEGGMSRVYLVLDTVLNKQWAAKEIKHVEDPARHELVVNGIVTEANMIKRLDHPAIPRIVDLVDEGGTLFVIMDYVEGHTLADLIAADGAQDEASVVDWGLQLCDVLEYLHQRTPPVIYRDMKPANVMLRPNGLVALIDFGISCEQHGDAADVSAWDSASRLGTRGFAPPEQYGDDVQADARSDVYALGATLYNLVTGKNPAEPPNVILPIRQLRPELSPGLERIIARATQLDPAERYQDCAEMSYELAHYQEQDDKHRAKMRRAWHGFVALVACSVLALVVGVAATIGYHLAINGDYDTWMAIAEQSADEAESRRAYLTASSIKSAEVGPYLGLTSIYRSDASFSADEEAELRGALLPHVSELRRSARWGELSFDIGKLYWYSYGVAEGGEDAEALSSAAGTRIRAASQWMHEAAEAESFESHEAAQVYADIADFNTQIVPLINEGSDAGLYRPYYERLASFVDATAQTENEVMRLSVANLALDALRTYSRKFRADGASDQELMSLAGRAAALAEETSSTTERLDAERSRALAAVQPAKDAVGDAYIDVGAS